MGQAIDKCNCFIKDEKNTYNIDENKVNTNTSSQISTVKSNFDANAFLQKNKLKLASSNKDKDNSDNPRIELTYPELNNKNVIRAIVELQSLIRGHILRKQFKVLKPILINETLDLINQYTQDFTSTSLIKAESYKEIFYDPQGWKNHYSSLNDEKKFNYNYGRTFDTKLLISLDKSYIYSGKTNIRNQRHGYGVMLTSDGIKYEGNWVSNKFTGWNKYIDSEGNVFIGKLISFI